MPTEPRTLAQPPKTEGEAAERLAQHLRDNPADALLPPTDLAERFDLNPQFAAAFLRGLRTDAAPKAAGNRLAPILRVANLAKRLWTRATDRPVLFVAATWLASILITVGAYLIGHRASEVAGYVSGVMSLLIVLTPTIQYACLFRHGMIRWALYGGLVCWLMVTPVVLFFKWLTGGGNPDEKLVGLILSSIGMLVLCFMYAAVGSLVSVLGGYVNMRRSDRAEQRLTRQQLLDRLFGIRERLQDQSAARHDVPSPLEWAWIPGFRRYKYLLSASAGFVISVAVILTYRWADPTGTFGNPHTPLQAVIATLNIIVSVLALVAVGFMAGGLRRAALCALAFEAGSLLPTLLPFGPMIDYRQTVELTQIIASAIYSVVIAGTAAIGAKIEERAVRERRIKRSDRATLTAEMVRIQWMLSPSTLSVCVMVVDASKSSVMKAEERDPLVVEWTFREYQQFIADISAKYSGRVHSTAGDGAVVAFPSCTEAFAAAQEIQTRIEAFNRDVSRLRSPFRLRIGLHTGELVAELSEVQYTAVIDVAAHIEASAPVGGIALTDKVADELSGERLAELKETVDGYHVFVALDPIRT